MTVLSQRDPRWADIILGTGKGTIGLYGCTITCLAMIIGTTPDVVNERMKAVGGFANGNLVIWDKIPVAFPGITINRVWSYNNDDVKAHIPNVLVEVPAAPIGGTGSHWVVYIGNQRLNDPWTGRERPTSDFPGATGYCSVSGTWATPQGSSTVSISKEDFERVMRKSTAYDQFCQTEKLDTNSADGAKMISVVDDLRRSLTEKETELQTTRSQRDEAVSKVCPDPSAHTVNPNGNLPEPSTPSESDNSNDTDSSNPQTDDGQTLTPSSTLTSLVNFILKLFRR